VKQLLSLVQADLQQPKQDGKKQLETLNLLVEIALSDSSPLSSHCPLPTFCSTMGLLLLSSSSSIRTAALKVLRAYMKDEASEYPAYLVNSNLCYLISRSLEKEKNAGAGTGTNSSSEARAQNGSS
jgi:hypothetical protein